MAGAVVNVNVNFYILYVHVRVWSADAENGGPGYGHPS
jgi:hypothetical protein